ELEPANEAAHRVLAYSQVLRGDVEGYRHACADALARLGKDPKPVSAYFVVRICGLGPGAVPDPVVPVRLMEQCVGKDRNSWYLHALGLAHYRAKQYEEAIARLEESRRVNPSWDQQTCVNGFVLALAHHRLGHADEARQWLDKTVKRLEEGT